MVESLRNLFKYRELLFVLTQREIQIRYKQSVLGIAWAIIQPLALMLMFTLVFSALLKIPSDGIPYPLFAYSALLPWTFFSNSLNRAIPSLETNAQLIKKVYFPRELFPVASVLAAGFDFLVSAAIFVGLMVYYRADVQFTVYLLYVVPILMIQIVFTLGICLFASAVNVYYRDVKHALPLLIQVWMYASPIIYPVSQVPERLQTIYFLNPMAGIIHSYRSVLVKGVAPTDYYLAIAAAGSVVLFLVCYFYFKRIEMEFADVV